MGNNIRADLGGKIHEVGMKSLHLIASGVVLGLLGCTGQPPVTLGVTQAQLMPCPSSPNCASSFAEDGKQVAPLPGLENSEASLARWHTLISANFEHAERVTQAEDYAHYTFRTPIGWVDDVELYWQPGVVHVRSASRIGYSDFGKNQSRVEALRLLWDVR